MITNTTDDGKRPRLRDYLELIAILIVTFLIGLQQVGGMPQSQEGYTTIVLLAAVGLLGYAQWRKEKPNPLLKSPLAYVGVVAVALLLFSLWHFNAS